MSQFVKKRNKESVFIKIAIDADSVILGMGAMAVITQDALTFLGYSKMNTIVMQIGQYRVECIGRKKML